jgi:hypothetical protein
MIDKQINIGIYTRAMIEKLRKIYLVEHFKGEQVPMTIGYEEPLTEKQVEQIFEMFFPNMSAEEIEEQCMLEEEFFFDAAMSNYSDEQAGEAFDGYND